MCRCTLAHTPHIHVELLWLEIGGSCLLLPQCVLGVSARPSQGTNPLHECHGTNLVDCCTDAVLGSFLAVGNHTISLIILLERFGTIFKVLWNKCFYESFPENERWVSYSEHVPAAPWPLPTDKHRILHFVQAWAGGWEWWFTDFRRDDHTVWFFSWPPASGNLWVSQLDLCLICPSVSWEYNSSHLPGFHDVEWRETCNTHRILIPQELLFWAMYGFG